MAGPNRIAGRVIMIPCGLTPEFWRRGEQDGKEKDLPASGRLLSKATAGHNRKQPNRAAKQAGGQTPRQVGTQASRSAPGPSPLLRRPPSVPVCLRCSNVIRCLVSPGFPENSPCCNGHLHLHSPAPAEIRNAKEEFLSSTQDLVCTSLAHLACPSLHLACTPRRPN